eukprot:14568460-Alexandrium_andersonii.AAC.1
MGKHPYFLEAYEPSRRMFQALFDLAQDRPRWSRVSTWAAQAAAQAQATRLSLLPHHMPGYSQLCKQTAQM